MVSRIAAAINGHAVIQCVRDKLICMISCDVRIYHKQAITRRGLDCRIYMREPEKVFCWRGIEIDLQIL